jgi:hypothetical protein
MNKLGKKATDIITGFKGVITAKAEFLHAPPRYELTPEKLHEGAPIKPVWLDETRLKVGGTKIKVAEIKPVIGLGADAEDSVTHYKGVVTGRFIFVNGCVRLEVSSKALKDGKLNDPEVFDEQRLAPQSKAAAERPGGPRPGPTPYSRP